MKTSPHASNKLSSLILVFLLCSAGQIQAASEPNYFSSNYHDRLGVSATATPDEIKKAYRKLMRKFHPDLNPDVDLKIVQSINEAYNALTNASQKTQTTTSTPQSQAPTAKPQETREQVLKDLYKVFNSKKATKALQSHVLFEAFSMGKYDIEAMLGEKAFNDIRDHVFSSSVWKDQNDPLWDLFIQGWGLYSIRTSRDTLTRLFSQLDPDDARLKKVLYDYDFNSVGGDFQTKTGRKNWLLVVGAQMLTQKKYLGTLAGEKLLDHNYEMWQKLKAGEDISPYPRDLWALEILKLLEVHEYAQNPKVIEMVREIPKLLNLRLLGLSGVFSDQVAKDQYREALKKHSKLFEGYVVRAPIDDLIWFYRDLSEEERNHQPETELKVLKRAFGAGKYDFESLISDKEFSNLSEEIFSRPIWNESRNGLFKLFVSGWGFYQLKYSSDLLGYFFNHIDLNNRDLNALIHYLDFGSTPGSDFSTREMRLEFVRPIVTQMLRQREIGNSYEERRLISYLNQQWKQLIGRNQYFSYLDKKWLFELVRTLDNETLRQSPEMLEIYQGLAKLEKDRRLNFEEKFQAQTYDQYRSKYKEAFEKNVRSEATTQATTFPTFELPAVTFCRMLFGGGK